MSLGGGIGLAVPLGDKVVLDFLGGYNSVSVKANYRNEHNERTVTGTIGVKLGLTVFIGEI